MKEKELMKEGDGLPGARSQMMKAFGTSDGQKEASNAQTYRQGLQPLSVELSLLTRHPTAGGEAEARGGTRGRKGVWGRERERDVRSGKARELEPLAERWRDKEREETEERGMRS